jgi:hypothetical protein
VTVGEAVFLMQVDARWTEANIGFLPEYNQFQSDILLRAQVFGPSFLGLESTSVIPV